MNDTQRIAELIEVLRPFAAAYHEGPSPFREGGRLVSISGVLTKHWKAAHLAVASVDERPKGQDPQGLGAKPASAVRDSGDAQTASSKIIAQEDGQ